MRNGLPLFLAVFTVAIGIGAAHAAPAPQGNKPIHIKANELMTDGVANTATFVGKVSTKQGDMTIFSDKLVVKYSSADQEVEKVEAFGNVRFIAGNRRGEANHATYETRTAKIVLEGNPVISQGDDIIKGKIITYFVDEKRSLVTSDPEKRVEVILHPKEKAKSGAAKP
jgi:lipopolysaccharide export system protein LptA